MSDAAKRNQTASLSRTERELAALGEGAGATKKAPGGATKPDAVAKPKKESVGTGKDNASENARRLGKAARDKLAAALQNQANARKTGNEALANRLDAVIARNRAAIKQIEGGK